MTSYYDDLVNQYNNTKDSSIKMTPTEGSNKKNQGTVYFQSLYYFKRIPLEAVEIESISVQGYGREKKTEI